MIKRLTTYLSIIILPTLLLATETSTSAVGQLVYFPFNGNANDASGSGYNGTTTGSVTFPATGGISGGYAYIAGGSDKLSITHNANFNMPDSFTVHFWFRQRSDQSAAQNLVYKGTSTTYNFYVFRQLWNQYNFGPVIAGYRSNVTGYWKQVSNSNQLTHNVWHHVAYTKTSTGHAYYLDSKLISSSNTTDPAKTNSSDIIICDSAIDTDLDEFQLYNRALSASEISSYYNSLDVTVPSSPTNLTATAQSGQVYLNWTASADYDVVKYRIFRSTTSGFTPSASNKIDSTSSSYFYDTNVTYGTTYYYKISAVDGAGHVSGYSSQASGSPSIAAPTGLTIAPSDKQITLKWNKNTETDFAKYIIYGDIWSWPWTKVDSTMNIGDTTKTITGLTNGTTYYYRIKAVDNSGGESGYSNEVNAIPLDNIAPAIPTGLTAASSNAQVVLKWQKNTESDFAKYIIYGGITASPTAKVDSLISIGDTTKTITGLTNGTTHYYRLTAVDTLGNESSYSGQVIANPLVVAPTGLTATPGDAQIALKWNKSTESIFAKYIIYGGTSPNPTVKKDSTTSISDTSKTITGLTNGTPYYYQVTVVDTNGDESAYSNQVSASPSASNPLPATPTGFAATPGDDQLTLNWDQVGDSDLAKYRVYRGTSNYSINILDSVLVSASPNTVYTDAVVDNDSLYYYYIMAVDNAGQTSGRSDTVHVMPTIVPEGLVAMYYFNGNTIDGSGDENDGTNYGAAQTYDRFGNWGKAYSFDGVDGYVDVPNEQQLRLNAPYTVSIWVNQSENNLSGEFLIGKSASHQGHRNYSIEVITGRKVTFTYHQYENTPISITHDIPLNLIEWYHILVVHDNSQIRMYLNNDLVQSQSVTTSDVVISYLGTPQNLGIGRHTYGSSDGYFNGTLDDIRIYDRALTVSEIQTLFEVGGWDPAPGAPQNLYPTPDNDRLALDWDPLIDSDLAKYRIYRGKTQSSISFHDSVMATVTSSPDTFYVDNAVDNDTLYYYYVTAVDSAGQVSSESDTVHVMPTIVPDGLVALYTFNGHVLDGSGEENDGTNYGVSLTTDHFGNWGKAYHFDGNNDYVTIPNSINGLTNLSVETWFKYTNTSNWRWIFGTTPGFVQLGVSVAAGDDILRYHFNTSIGSFTDGDGSHHLNPDQWHQLSLTYDGATLKAYVNGILDYERAWSGQISVTDQVAIGRGLSNEDFYGSIDEFRIYDRVITASEIQTLFDAGGWDPAPGTPTNLTAAGANQSVNLNWNEVTDPDLAKYRIYRRKATTGQTLIDSVMAASPPDTFYVDNNVINDTIYYYQVTAVDSAGQTSGFSNEVNATPTDRITVELMVEANSISSVGTGYPGYPLNTNYSDVKHQSLYHAADLSNAGISSGATITAFDIYPAELPGMDLSSFRIATAWTNVAALSDSFITTNVVYGPTYHYPADFPTETWVRFPIAPIVWNGQDNLVVEFSHDNAAYDVVGGGGVYLRETGTLPNNPNRGRRGWSLDAGNYPFTDNMQETYDDRVAYLQVTYTSAGILPPSNVTAVPSYQQVDLSWTASLSDSVANYMIYRGISSEILTNIGSVASTATTYSDAGLVNGTPYYYGIKTKQTDNDSSAMTTPVSAVPSVETPVNLSVAAAPQQVTLTWDAPSGSGVAKTYIYQRDASTTTFLADSTSDGTTALKTITGLANGTMYYFAIKYKGQDGTTSAYSDTVNATPDYTGPTFWVATDGNNATGDGSSTSPFLTIQHAIERSAAGDTVKIKPGTYSGYGNYDIDFNHKNIVVMGYGGADSVTIDVQGSASNRHRGFKIMHHDYSDSAKIVGLTIINGFAPEINDDFPGGGGAIALYATGALQIENCIIGPGNRGGIGAGIAVGYSNTTISGTVVKGNNITIGTDFFNEGMGVGIYAESWDQGHLVTIQNCVIRNNQGTVPQSGTPHHIVGGGLYLTGNQAEYRVLNTIIAGNSITQNNNSWHAFGGAVRVASGATAYFIHTTITGNESLHAFEDWNGQGGAIGISEASTLNVLNSIIWANNASDVNGEMITNWNPSDIIEINYSGLQEAHSGTGNIVGDPFFTDPANGDYTLSHASAMLGAGATSAMTAYPGATMIPITDKAGNTRPNPSGSNPDMGAFENSLGSSPVPSAPAGLAAASGDGQVTLSWTQHTENDVTGYGIYYGTSASPTVVQDTTIGRATTSYIVSGLSNNVTYYFRITAIDQDGYESGFSDEISAIPQFSGATVYVDSASVATNPDGSSLSNAFTSIMDAINATATENGHRVLVLPGTYPEEIDLMGKNIILQSSEGPDSTIIDAGGRIGDRSALSFDASAGYNYNGYGDSTKIIGFTFTNGDDSDPLVIIEGPQSGYDWAPVFENCRFTNTTSLADPLPIIWLRRTNVTFDGCEFRNLNVMPSSVNQAIVQAPIYVVGPHTWENDYTSYTPKFLNCVIAENSSKLTNGDNNTGLNFQGGAVYIGFGAIPYFENTRIDSNEIDGNNNTNNWSVAMGGGVYISEWYANGPAIQFVNCSISDNTVNGMEVRGGGIYNRYALIEFTNCKLTGNTANSTYQTHFNPDAYGGAIANDRDGSWGTNPNASMAGIAPGIQLINCTVADNELIPSSTINSSWGGAGITRSVSGENPVFIFNSIFYDNWVNGTSDYNRMNLSTWGGQWVSENSIIDYTIVEYAEESGIYGDYIYDFEPNFVGDGDYSLSQASVALGKGIYQFEGISAPAFDYNNDIRPNPTSSNPDLGAFESSLSTTPYPSKPQNLVVSAVGDSSITLSWSANTEDDLSQYKIYYGTTEDEATTLLDSVSGTPSYTATGLDNYTLYYFAVSAEDLDGFESSKSDEVSGEPKWAGPLWYVNESAGISTSGKDGSPALPFGDIGDVFENTLFSSGDTILVLPGTYNDGNDRNLYAPDFPFVLMSRDGPNTTIIELKPSTTLAYRFINFDQGCDTTTQVIGFTIQNGGGYENGGYAHGGALIIRGSYDWNLQQYSEANPLIRNCIFTGNVSDESNNSNGGAVWIEGSSPVFVDCEFNGNSAPEQGGAIYITTRNENNVDYYSAPEFYSCTFTNNQTTNTNTWNGQGGAIFSDSPELTFNSCTFLDNSAWNSGGALYVQNWGEADKWLVIKNSLFAGNTTVATVGYESMGGAFRNNGDFQVIIEHVTITDNTSSNGGAAIAFENAFIYNSILWNNSLRSDNSPVEGANGDVEILYSLVENGDLVPGFDNNSGLTFDPVFTDPGTGDYTLSPASVALGAGTTQYTSPRTGNTVTIDGVDLAGNARVNPSGTNPDLGAYEHELTTSPFPAPVQNLVATPLHQAVLLDWDFSQDQNVDRYVAYVSDDSITFTVDDTVSGRFTTRTTVGGLTNGEDYWFYVTAIDTGGFESSPSIQVKTSPFFLGPVWVVDTDNGSISGEGSFDNPLKYIRDAIETAVDGDTVMLMPGTYTGTKNRNLDFQYNNDVWNEGVKNLVLMSMYGPDTTIIDIENNGNFLWLQSGETFTSKVIGVTIKNATESAIGIHNQSQLKIKNCIFQNNTNSGWGGAISMSNGNNYSTIIVKNTIFSNNFADQNGGAIGITGGTDVKIVNCIFYQNSSNGEGGAIIVDEDNTVLQVVHSLFLENHAGTSFGAISGFGNASIGVINSIFWDNTAGGANQSSDINTANTVDHCILQEGSQVMFLGENYTFDPEIEDPASGDFSLSEYSGAIGLGLENYYDYFSDQDKHVPSTDFLGNARPQPDSTLPDIGPIEHQNAESRRSVYYVDNNGNDNNDGLTPANALKTIQGSLNKTSMRDTIELAAGTYSGLGNRELSMNGITRVIRSTSGSASTIIDCENFGRAFVFNNEETNSVLIKGVTIKNGLTTENGGAVIISGADPVFENVIFENNSAPSGSGGAVYASDSRSRFVNCVFLENHAAESGAVSVGSGDVLIDFSTAVGNRGDDNISFSGDISISNSIIWYNSPVDNGVSVVFSDVMGGKTGIGNYNGRPGFVDGLNGDFHLQNWSPVIGIASGSANVLYDMEGTARSDSIPDMGAYENILDAPGAYTKQFWYVSPTGSDDVTADMGTEFNPHKTIQHALNRAIYDDEIRILPGNYNELLNNWGKDITIVGNSGVPDNVTIDGSFKITGGTPNLSDLHLTNIHGNNNVLEINDGSAVSLHNLLIENSNHDGVTINDSATVTMYNMTISRNAVGINDNSTGIVAVSNSIIWNNTSSIIGTPTITYSAVEGSFIGSGNISDDPLFVNVADGNFRIEIQSPCIDAGDPTMTYDTDSTVADMGAFPLLRDFYSGATSGNIEIAGGESAILTDDLVVAEGDTMVVDAGGTVYFEPGVTLTVEGLLGISGTARNPVSFKSTDPDSFYGGVVITSATAGRAVDDVYSYMVIQDVGADFIPLTINGNATIEHVTIAGNENSTSMVVNDGTVTLNYSILEGSVSGSGTTINTGSFISSTDQFENYGIGDYMLKSSATAIDLDTTEIWLDPDYTFADAGSYFHDQSGYAALNITVLYPLPADTIPVSPDSSSLAGGGVTVAAQVFNVIGHYKTSSTINWENAGFTDGTFDNNITNHADLRGRVSNTFYTSTTTNDLNSVSIEDNGIFAQSGYFKVVAGVPDSIWIIEESDMTINQNEEREISGNIIDQFGNSIANGTPITWEFVPSNVADFVNIVSSDEVTQNGSAAITLQVKSDVTWSFDFVMQLSSNGISSQSGTYNFYEVTAPESVVDMTINPIGWTSVNNFTISWTNPPENSGIAGAHYTIDGGDENYVPGPGIQSLSNIELDNNAVSLINVWLEDNLGNENSGNAKEIEAKWDNTAPDNFTLSYPMDDWYNQSDFRFQWNTSSDAMAGLERYDLVINSSDVYTIDPDSTTYLVPSEFAEGTHSWSVVAFDSAGNETTTSNPQTFRVDFTSPNISHNPVLEGTENTNVTITASFTDDPSGIEIAEAYYRKGGEVQWEGPVDMTTLNSFNITSSFVTSSGLEYYIYSRDAAGNETYKPSQGYYSTSITITGGLSSTDRWPTGIPNGSAVTRYQLLSFPGQAANSTPTDILVDDLGEYDDTKWRLFEYGGSGAWAEFANISTIKPGSGYFLIVNDPGLNINTGQTRTVASDADFPVTLSTGDWIMFGNPYDFNIPLTNVYINDSTNLAGDDNLYTYDGSWTNPTEIEPWKGYIYKSTTANTIYITPRKSNGGMAKRLEQEIVLMENEWLVDIKARNGLGVDELNTVGVLATANDEYDDMDAFEPPMLPGGVSLRMNNSDWAQNPDIYTKDIRSIKEDGEFWDMEMAAEDNKYNVYLYFEGHNDIPSDFDVFLIDVTLGVAQDLRWNPVYRYAVSNSKTIHNIRFIAGTKDFLSQNNAGVDLYPDKYSISQNYPNPFNPQTSILITLEDIAIVDLIVYNILGKEVTRILDNELRPAGYHNMIWKGLNRDGKRVASGVYFYTTRIKDVSGKMILNKTKKMIMVK